jgi:hypothetical protein
MKIKKSPPKFLNIQYLLAALWVLALFLPTVPAQAQSEGGIAISGSFYRHHFQMIPGEKMKTPQSEIVVYNNYDRAIQVKITATAPQGVEVNQDGKILNLEANTNVSLPVLLNLGEEVVPGEYEIHLAADVIPNNIAGVTVVGSAEMRTKLTVFGESGVISVNTITPDQQPFYGQLYLYRREGEQLAPAFESTGDVLNERLVPGDYVLLEYYQGEVVAETQFTIVPNDDKKITLTARTIFVDGLSVVPVTAGDSNQISSVRVDYTLRNIFEPTEPLTLVLVVSYNGKLIEELEMVTIPGLDIGSQSSRFTYIPPQGWQGGRYEFEVRVLSKNLVFSRSKPFQLDLSKPVSFEATSPMQLAGGALLVVLLATILLLLVKKKS